MTPAQVQHRVAQLEKSAGRTGPEASTCAAMAARLRKSHPALFDARTGAPLPLPPEPVDRAASERPGEPLYAYRLLPRPRGTLSSPLGYGHDFTQAYRWLLALGVAQAAGCIVAEGCGAAHFFGSAGAVALAVQGEAELRVLLEADALAAEARMPPETPPDRRAFFGALYRRAWIAGHLQAAEQARSRRSGRDISRRQAAAASKVERAGWKVVRRPPEDPWGPP